MAVRAVFRSNPLICKPGCASVAAAYHNMKSQRISDLDYDMTRRFW
jgi:hypothetical protein